jgi:hypothetical protein
MTSERWKFDLKNGRTWILLLTALAMSLLSGWGGLHFIGPLFFLGFPGGVAMYFVIGGAHGPSSHIQGILGGFTFVIVNTVFFYYVFRFLARRLPSNLD